MIVFFFGFWIVDDVILFLIDWEVDLVWVMMSFGLLLGKYFVICVDEMVICLRGEIFVGFLDGLLFFVYFGFRFDEILWKLLWIFW